MSAPSDARILSSVPDGNDRTRTSRPITPELVVDGEGAAPVPGTIAQDLESAPGRTTVTMTEEGYSYRWKGNSRDKVVVALGIQLAHRRLPPEFVASWRVAVGFTVGSCRAPTIRAVD